VCVVNIAGWHGVTPYSSELICTANYSEKLEVRS
jgi:hypothetical protein